MVAVLSLSRGYFEAIIFQFSFSFSSLFLFRSTPLFLYGCYVYFFLFLLLWWCFCTTLSSLAFFQSFSHLSIHKPPHFPFIRLSFHPARNPTLTTSPPSLSPTFLLTLNIFPHLFPSPFSYASLPHMTPSPLSPPHSSPPLPHPPLSPPLPTRPKH